MRELQRKLDDAVAEVGVEPNKQLPNRRASEKRKVCPPKAEQLFIFAEPTYL